MKPSAYLELLDKEFRVSSTDRVSESYLIGGALCELIFPSSRLKDQFPQPFEKRSGSPDFQIYIWDGEGISPAWTMKDYRSKGEVKGFNSCRFRLVYDAGSRVLSVADLKQRKAFWWTPDVSALPFWEKGSPLRNILHWFLPLKGSRLVHAAGIGDEKGGVLIVGKGGAGKSTTALSCLHRGMGYCGDDYCALEKGSSSVVRRVYSTAKVKSGRDKVVIAIDQQYPERLLECFPLKAMVLPQITELKRPQLKELKRSHLLRELAASTILQLPGENRELLAWMAEIVKEVPCYLLQLSQDYQANAEKVQDVCQCNYSCL